METCKGAMLLKPERFRLIESHATKRLARKSTDLHATYDDEHVLPILNEQALVRDDQYAFDCLIGWVGVTGLEPVTSRM